MELIPILSTIILVATISTFILAVGAYILFKIREGKVQPQPPTKPANLNAEYIVPKEPKIKKFFLDDGVQPNHKNTMFKERYNPVAVKENISEQDQDVIQEMQTEQKIELPKQKFLVVQTLNASDKTDESNAGEIKWR
ncbi:MAG: hypothetical protein KJN64_00130 [Ignavibacteria bacterium]|nr:hypothetical protein [Ignavibacteria bacterium]MBT8383079.1 hypothetical protein [Ignavibacteria bacterium]MBT8392382.1 hypothetical protein [Ignavibacteria bacterium]NNJ52951.1 hypothetical protein [Ignavibacteriaceae bacterium]NNL22194.1 hypothetical protein [Ignavibacteriaceae bacterium]